MISGNEDTVYKLKKALYGLKQAPRALFTKIDSYFCQTGFKRSDNEPTLYLKKNGNDFLLICLYVDDMIYIDYSNLHMQEFKSRMMGHFDMKDLGFFHYFLGFEVKQSKDRIFIS